MSCKSIGSNYPLKSNGCVGLKVYRSRRLVDRRTSEKIRRRKGSYYGPGVEFDWIYASNLSAEPQPIQYGRLATDSKLTDHLKPDAKRDELHSDPR